MALDDRVKGLETITNRLDTSVGDLVKKVDFLSKTVENSSKPHWTVPIFILLVLGWIGWLSLQVISHGNKLTGIGAILSPQETLKNLTSAVSPDPQKAKQELAQVTDSFQKLNTAKVKLPERTIDETSGRLTIVSNTHQDLPETWSAIGAFITYRSQMVHGWAETNLPLCDNQFHRARITKPIDKGSNTITHGPVEINDCKMILDSPDATGNLSVDLSMADVIFTHCVVFYNGGPIIFVPVKMAATEPPHFVGNVLFRDCSFVLSVPSIPDQRGQELIRALLDSPNGDIKLERIS
jgi:hypothetical protein